MRKAKCHPDLRHCAKGLCVTCYAKWRGANPVTPKQERKATCHPERKHKAFGLCTPCHSKTRSKDDQAERDAARYWADPKKATARTMAWREANPRQARVNDLRRYGITPEEYDEILAKQGGVCPGCLGTCTVRKRLSVDHDHETGIVCGLLCDPCNKAKGLAKNSPGNLRRLAQYIEDFLARE